MNNIINVIESYDSKELILKALSLVGINLIPLDEFEWTQEPQDTMGSGWNEHLVGEGYPARAANHEIIVVNRISQGYPNLAGTTRPLCGIRREDFVRLKNPNGFDFRIIEVNTKNVTFDFYA